MLFICIPPRILSVFSVALACSSKSHLFRNFSTTRIRAIDMDTVNTTERLKRLRDLMRENKVDLYSRGYEIS